MFNFLDDSLKPISSVGRNVWCPIEGKASGKEGTWADQIPPGFYPSQAELDVVKAMGGLTSIVTAGRKSVKNPETGEIEGPQAYLLTADKLYEFQDRLLGSLGTIQTADLVGAQGATQAKETSVMSIKAVKGTLEYGLGGKFNNLPLVDGLTLASGGARSGKTWMLDRIAGIMVQAYQKEKSSHIPIYLSWGEPEPEAMTDYTQFVRACNLAFTLALHEKKKVIILVDSFKVLAHMGGGLAKEGISRNLFAWVTALSGLLARVSTPMFATFNPQAESLEGLYKSLEASVSTLVQCKSPGQAVFSTRIQVEGGPESRQEEDLSFEAPPSGKVSPGTKFVMPGRFQDKFMPWSGSDLDLFGNKGKATR
jgi:hypothetical protein